MNITQQILAAINFSNATAIVMTAGLALIALAFLSFVLRKGQEAASGRIGEEESDDDKDD